MNWAYYAIRELQAGKQASLIPHGSSMSGKVEDGDTVLIDPVIWEKCPECLDGLVGGNHERPANYEKCLFCNGKGTVPKLDNEDIVLVRVKGSIYLHLIVATKGYGNSKRYQIGNNRGGINGWVGASAIYGVAVKVVPERLFLFD